MPNESSPNRNTAVNPDARSDRGLGNDGQDPAVTENVREGLRARLGWGAGAGGAEGSGSGSVRIVALLVIVAVLVAAVWTMMLRRPETHVALVPGVTWTHSTSARVVQVLASKNIAAEAVAAGSGTSAVMISPSLKAKALAVLEETDLGPRSVADIRAQVFQNRSLFEAPTERETRELRANEQSAKRMIEECEGILEVDVVIQPTRRRSLTTTIGSVLVRLQTVDDRPVTPGTVESIRTILEGLIPDLKQHTVRIIDNKGRPYAGNGDDGDSDRRTAWLRTREDQWRDRILRELAWIDDVSVNVSVGVGVGVDANAAEIPSPKKTTDAASPSPGLPVRMRLNAPIAATDRSGTTTNTSISRNNVAVRGGENPENRADGDASWKARVLVLVPSNADFSRISVRVKDQITRIFPAGHLLETQVLEKGGSDRPLTPTALLSSAAAGNPKTPPTSTQASTPIPTSASDAKTRSGLAAEFSGPGRGESKNGNVSPGPGPSAGSAQGWKIIPVASSNTWVYSGAVVVVLMGGWWFLRVRMREGRGLRAIFPQAFSGKRARKGLSETEASLVRGDASDPRIAEGTPRSPWGEAGVWDGSPSGVEGESRSVLERARDLARMEPDTAVAVLNRWLGQGGAAS